MTFPTPEQADALGIVDPTAYKEMVGEKIRTNKTKQERSRARIAGRPSDLSKGEVCSPDQTSLGHGSDLSKGEVPPNLGNTEPMFLTEPEIVDLRTDLTLPRARDREQDQISPSATSSAALPATVEYTAEKKIKLALDTGHCPLCYLTGRCQPALPGSTHCHQHQGAKP
jgi:hypothetical protein